MRENSILILFALLTVFALGGAANACLQTKEGPALVKTKPKPACLHWTKYEVSACVKEATNFCRLYETQNRYRCAEWAK